MHEVRCRLLRERLKHAAVSAEHEENDECWRLAVLCLNLLQRHQVDPKGRCRCCRKPGRWRWGWSRRCTVLPMLSLYLEQPREFLTGPDD